MTTNEQEVLPIVGKRYRPGWKSADSHGWDRVLVTAVETGGEWGPVIRYRTATGKNVADGLKAWQRCQMVEC